MTRPTRTVPVASLLSYWQPEKLVLDDEACGMALRLLRGIEPKDDFPARPLLEELLREKHLLIASHTRRHLRGEIRFPGLVIDRSSEARWREEGSPTLTQRASREVERLVGAWTPSRLGDDVRRELVLRMEGAARRAGLDVLPDRDPMRGIVRFAPADAAPEARRALARAGVPESVEPPPRTLGLLADAVRLFHSLAEPRAIVAEVAPEAFAAIHRGDHAAARAALPGGLSGSCTVPPSAHSPPRCTPDAPIHRACPGSTSPPRAGPRASPFS